MARPVMTPEQRQSARGALNLDGRRRMSEGNRRTAQVDSMGHDMWREMVANGWAVEVETYPTMLTLFRLTRSGAEAVLAPGETLNPADFPPIGAH
ncbi:hypothetical protein [Aureimonas sp. ME7]|uniref:hypothetical protein n=1 Tax=Aureimonas sp. ME7 TaxID=2744252 RepID=UPI0015F7D5F2|nr:hypothetical protein [Aureimonas sp. ME7]